MIVHAIPFTVKAGGFKLTAYKYRQIDETRSSHCQKAVRQRVAAKRRRKK